MNATIIVAIVIMVVTNILTFSLLLKKGNRESSTFKPTVVMLAIFTVAEGIVITSITGKLITILITILPIAVAIVFAINNEKENKNDSTREE